MEEKRVHISHTQLINWYEDLARSLFHVSRFFIFNMDETRLDNWVYSLDILVVVPESHPDDQTEIPFQRKSKRATLTACIAADGSSLKPLVIMSTGSIAEDIEEAGFTRDKVVFIFQNHGFMTKRIFQFWCQEIFFPYVQEKRTELKYSGKALLLMDQFSGHQYDDFDNDLLANLVECRPLVPHTSHLSQPLDQILFSNFKCHFGNIRYHKYATAASNRIIRILKAWYMTAIPDIITSTFTAAGIVPDRVTTDSFICCRVDLQRSLHMKDMKPDPELSELTDGDSSISPFVGMSQQGSSPVSSRKSPQQRIQIVKLDVKSPEKKTVPVEGHPESQNPGKKQMTLEDSFKKSPKKLSKNAEGEIVQFPKNSEGTSF
jgi:hypothetical protein